MKIIGIHSSPQKRGNTGTLVKKLLYELEKLGAEVELVDLAREELAFCKGCMSCMKTGKCCIPDSLDEIRFKMANADGLILGSPSYGIRPNAIMKNFLDRIGLFNAYAAMYGDKYIIGVSTAGGIGAKQVAKQLTEIVQCLFRFGKVVGTLHVLRGHERVEKIPDIDNKISKLALQMYNAIDKKRRYPFQNLFKKILFRIFLRRIFINNLLQNKDDKMRAVYNYLIDNKILSI